MLYIKMSSKVWWSFDARLKFKVILNSISIWAIAIFDVIIIAMSSRIGVDDNTNTNHNKTKWIVKIWSSVFVLSYH